MTGFGTDLLVGLAEYLAAAGLGLTWSESGAYTTAQVGIVVGNVPQSPDRIVTLSTYGVSDSPDLSDSVLALQVRCRWAGQDLRPVNDLADSIYNLLHGKTMLVLSTGVTIVQCMRQSFAPIGQDENNRWSNSSNYYLAVHRPSTNRT